MKHETTNYKGFAIIQRVDVKSHCAEVQKDGETVKMIAGAINPDGSTDVISKAKKYIDNEA